jgi:hypothetical protein
MKVVKLLFTLIMIKNKYKLLNIKISSYWIYKIDI